MSEFQGSVPVAADAVRVWRGYRADRSPAGWAPFADFLSQTLFPVEATWRPVFGLTCYLAGVKAADGDAIAPDEFALVFYESQAVYDAGVKTVAGSIYPMFPDAAFPSEGGRSGYPSRYPGSLTLNTAYFAFDAPVDWYHGSGRCRVATLLPGQSNAALLASVKDAIDALQAAPPDGMKWALERPGLPRTTTQRPCWKAPLPYTLGVVFGAGSNRPPRPVCLAGNAGGAGASVPQDLCTATIRISS